ncbi:uncharacterized protein LOC144916724 [Branchiostoma floridae x Branchiostoma belcheri]
MYEQAEPVRSPFSGPGSRQTSGQPKPGPVQQSGSRGRVRHGNGASDKQREDPDTSSHTYEDAEEVKRYATSADRAYPGGASGRRGVCSFLRARRSWLAAGIAVLLSLGAVGLAPLTFSNKQEISQLSTTVDALKRDQDDIRQLTTTVDALKRDQDDIRQLTTTVDALKRDQDDIRQLTTTVDALKRDQDDIRQLYTTVDALKLDQDDIRQLTTTVDALKRDQDDIRQLTTTVDALKLDQDDIRQLTTTVDALKRDQDDIRQLTTTVDALKRDQDDIRQLTTTVDALKRDQDDIRQLTTTVDALKRDQDDIRQLTTTVDALKRDQDDIRQLTTTVDALKRDQDDMRQLTTTVDALKRDQDDMSTTVYALKRDLDNERIRTATLEQRLHKIWKTLLSCPEGYTIWRGICYNAFDTKKTFDQAAAACGEDSGTLAMPRDAETNAFLIFLHNSVRDDQDFWFGLHDQRKEGRFEWMDGSALGSYSSWGKGQPDNRGDEDCVIYSRLPVWKDKWADSDCDRWCYFICQTAPGPP